jgi:hypothetical protein
LAAQLRFGELVALRRRDVDPVGMELRVRKATATMEDGTSMMIQSRGPASVRSRCRTGYGQTSRCN